MAADQNMRSHSNLQSFLNCTTPSVQSYSIPKAYARDLNSRWQLADKDNIEFFHLENLWEQYDEWSAYGAGVPLRLQNGELVSQYYTPFLSAIQIYTTKALILSRTVGEDTESDSSSDRSESEKFSRSCDGASEDSGFDLDGSWPTREQIGHLYLQFNDGGSPYARVPLVDKIWELALNYPRLTSFRSAEISPASWMSVAWYPIYHIPARGRVKELSACFLTYHTISSSFRDHIPGEAETSSSKAGTSGTISGQVSNRISLHPFGLATHKMQGSLWTNPRAGDPEKITTLYSAADSWLKQLRFQHEDFNYFTTHSAQIDPYPIC